MTLRAGGCKRAFDAGHLRMLVNAKGTVLHLTLQNRHGDALRKLELKSGKHSNAVAAAAEQEVTARKGGRRGASFRVGSDRGVESFHVGRLSCIVLFIGWWRR